VLQGYEPLEIPQHNSPNVAIELKECSKASETPGVIISPDSRGDAQHPEQATNRHWGPFPNALDSLARNLLNGLII
jgi:hypothetical protein